MDVAAYDRTVTPLTKVDLGAIAQQIWVNGFKRSQDRTIQVSKPIRAPIPTLYDRLTKLENFSFAAGRSFDDVGSALIHFGTWPDQVPTLAHLSFTQGNQTVWLGNAGIQRVELIEKNGALVIFGYTIINGAWSKNKPS